MVIPAHRVDHFCAHHYLSAARLCIAGVQNHKAGILNPAIGIFIGFRKAILKRCAFDTGAQINGRGRRQDLSPTQRVIK